MIKLYLDWNVMSQMKNGQHQRLKDILRNNDLFLIPFSTSHLTDIFSSFKDTTEQRKLIEDDLNFITEITENNCLYNSNKKIAFGYKDPHELFEDRIEQKDLFNDISIDGLMNIFNSNELGKELGVPLMESLKNLPLEDSFKQAYDNPKSAEMMEKIFPGLKDDLTMEGWFRTFSNMFKGFNEDEDYKNLREILQKGVNINRDRIYNITDPYKLIEENYKKLGIDKFDHSPKSDYSPEWFDKISNEYMKLDMHGYQEDRINVKKGRKETFQNTTEDSFHAAFASTCNFYVLNDKKCYNKTEQVYEKLGINTLVFKPNEFLEYFDKYLNVKDYKLDFEIISDLMGTQHFIETKTDDGIYHTFYPPYFFFGFFNKIVLYKNNDGERTTFLSQNKPTNYFVLRMELKNLVGRLLKFLGKDFEGLEELKDQEFETENWLGRKWILGKFTLKLLAPNKHIQLYFELEQ